MKAVVMAGGFGTRIQPLTHSRPKPMLPIMNKAMMEYTMMSLKELGIKEFIVLLYFKPEVIQNYFKDGSDFGIDITYVIPDDDYGTAGAVKCAQEYIGNENFVIVSGDLVTDFKFKELFDFHNKRKSKLTIGLTSVENPLEFGVVICNEDNEIEKFLEKPSWSEVFSDTINTGIYVIEPEILDLIPEKENFDFAKDLFPTLMEDNITLMGYTLQGYWRDVGNPKSYRDVHEDIFKHEFSFKIPGKKKEYPEGILYTQGDNNSIDKTVEIIGTVVLGENITIEQNVQLKNVVIGNNTKIGKSSKIKNSVIWNDVTIEKSVVLDNCVICNNNHIGKGVIASSGLILAENCDIGELSKIEHDITIWADKIIEPASIITNNIILGNKYKNSVFEHGSIYGKSNIELTCEMAIKIAEAFAAQLPVNATIIVGNDYDKNSRMLKRAFLSGIVSSGVNVLDIQAVAPSVLRFILANCNELIAGVHFKRCIGDATNSEITFFNEESMRIDSNMAKKIEKAFFSEKFRRVDFQQIGDIKVSEHKKEIKLYQKSLMQKIDHKIIKHENFKVAIDPMHGIAADILNSIINKTTIENIVLNSFYDEIKLSNLETLENKSFENVSKIVKALNYNLGIIIYPNAQKLRLVDEKGRVLNKIETLYAVLKLLNMEKSENKKRVFLPVWAPDMMDFDNIIIEKGAYSNFTLEQLKKYDLIATVDGNYAFTEFSYTRDAIYASFKIMELLSINKVKLSTLIESFEEFYYRHFHIPCPQKLKGKMMRKFLQEAKDKKSSAKVGVKIWENDTDWILMLPHQYSESLNLYIQAKDSVSGEKIYNKYIEKMENWKRE